MIMVHLRGLSFYSYHNRSLLTQVLLVRFNGLPSDDEQDQFFQVHKQETNKAIAKLPNSAGKRELLRLVRGGRVKMLVKDSDQEDVPAEHKEMWDTCGREVKQTIQPNDLHFFEQPVGTLGRLLVNLNYPRDFEDGFVGSVKRLVREVKISLRASTPYRKSGAEFVTQLRDILTVPNSTMGHSYERLADIMESRLKKEADAKAKQEQARVG